MGKDLNGKNIGEGFTQRKDGRYMARGVVNGIKITLYDMDLKNLKKKFRAEKKRIENEVDPIDEAVIPQKQITLNEWFEEWFQTCKLPRLKSSTAAVRYKRKFVNRFSCNLGVIPISDLNQITIQKAVNALIEAGGNVRNIKDATNVMKQALDSAVANKIITTNPCIGITFPDDCVVSERRVMDTWEIDLLKQVTEGRYYSELYRFALMTGMRVGELGGLQWQDIDFENNCIHVNRSLSIEYPKTGKIMELTTPKTPNSVRTIPFFDNVRDVLISWKKKQDATKAELGARWRNKEFGDLVFTTSLGSPLTKYAFQRDIDCVVNDMKQLEAFYAQKDGRPAREIYNLYPHAFRHTFATLCLMKGLEPIFVQRIMGHSNYATTVRYTHITDSLSNRELCKTANFL